MNPLAHSIELPVEAPARVLACGAYLKNRACLLDGRQAHWSVLHGDLDSADHRRSLNRSVQTLQAMAGGPIEALAHDLHPDFYSTQVGQTLAQSLGVPAIAVQHHHAHIAVGIAELGIENPVVGAALDGMGWGSDASAWGGEVLWLGGTGHVQHWQRLDHLPALALPGGDAAAREPWRMAASALYALGRGCEIEARFGEVVGLSSARLVRTLLQRQLNCPQSTSAGRWFDAAVGALGICTHQAHEAQAAMALERMAAQWLAQHHTDTLAFDVSTNKAPDMFTVVADLFDLAGGTPEALGKGAADFHIALANMLSQAIVAGAQRHNTRQVVLGGGCFVNQTLRHLLEARLQQNGMTTLAPRSTDLGDAGLALGQAWIAAFSLEK